MAKFKKGDRVRVVEKYGVEIMRGKCGVYDGNGWVYIDPESCLCGLSLAGHRHAIGDENLELVQEEPKKFDPKTDYFYTKVENKEEFDRLKGAVMALGIKPYGISDAEYNAHWPFMRVGCSAADPYDYQIYSNESRWDDHPFLPLEQALERLGAKPEEPKKLPENTVVHVPTQEEYDHLMGIYEELGWKWCGGVSPKEDDFWAEDREATCIDLKDDYRRASKKWHEQSSTDWKIISLSEAIDILNEVYGKSFEKLGSSLPPTGVKWERYAVPIDCPDEIPVALPAQNFQAALSRAYLRKGAQGINEELVELALSFSGDITTAPDKPTNFNNPLSNKPKFMDALKQSVRGLSKTVRLRRNYNVEDVEGNLTDYGMEIVLNHLWQSDEKLRKAIDEKIEEIEKEKKKK